jgi:hypothetical protein
MRVAQQQEEINYFWLDRVRKYKCSGFSFLAKYVFRFVLFGLMACSVGVH